MWCHAANRPADHDFKTCKFATAERAKRESSKSGSTAITALVTGEEDEDDKIDQKLVNMYEKLVNM